MIFPKPQQLRDRILEVTGRKAYSEPIVLTDTSNFFNIVGGNVLRLGGNDYYVTGDACEGRFGMDSQPKLWVKYAFDLTRGEKKIIKLVFDEEFSTRLGYFLIRAKRSAEKEKQFLDSVRGHPSFMQGEGVLDSQNNLVRIIDLIRGKSLFNYVLETQLDHETYYVNLYPTILSKLITCVEGMQFAASKGMHHGDIRNDHIFIEADTALFRWIDFDYTVNYADYDLWCIGNLITFTAAGGLLLHKDVAQNKEKYPDCRERITHEDCSLYHKYRIANIKKVYPYISQKLNDICMRYSVGKITLYEDYNELIKDLKEVKDEIESS